MANADRLQLSTLKETTYGTYPSGSFQILRYTSETLSATNENQNSSEIRGDRQIADVKRTSFGAEGTVNFELSYGSFDNELEYALLADSTWDTGTTDEGGTTISAANSDNSFNDSGSNFSGLSAGDYIRVSGFTEAANNGVFKIDTATSGKLTVIGKTIVDESAGDTVKIDELDKITNGTTLTTLAIQKNYQDLTTTFSRFTGMGIDSLSIEIPTNGIITGSVNYIGKDEVSSASGSSTASATTTGIFNSVDDVDAILENDVSYPATDFSFNITNNIRQRLQIGTLGSASLAAGTVDVSGTLRAYFATPAAYNKFLNQTSTSLSAMCSDSLGNAYVFEFPEVKFTGGSRVAEGQNQDIMADLQWSAFMDPTDSYTVRIHRHSA